VRLETFRFLEVDLANILILEDEQVVRKLLGLILRRGRNDVKQAGTIDEAERICRSGFKVEILVADVRLTAGASGTGFARQLIQSQPNARILFMSGFPEADWSNKDLDNLAQMPRGSYAVIEKPMTPQSVEEAVQRLLVRGTDAL